LLTENLDRQVTTQLALTKAFETALETALAIAYSDCVSRSGAEKEHLFLQRILYRINRLNFFWYGSLQQYTNERSVYLQWVRDRIETAWQAWELAQLDVEQLRHIDVKQALAARANEDLGHC
jgi:hypothetical protein